MLHRDDPDLRPLFGELEAARLAHVRAQVSAVDVALEGLVAELSEADSIRWVLYPLQLDVADGGSSGLMASAFATVGDGDLELVFELHHGYVPHPELGGLRRSLEPTGTWEVEAAVTALGADEPNYGMHSAHEIRLQQLPSPEAATSALLDAVGQIRRAVLGRERAVAAWRPSRES